MLAVRVPPPTIVPLPRTRSAMVFVTDELLRVLPLKMPKVPLPKALLAANAKVPALIKVPPL